MHMNDDQRRNLLAKIYASQFASDDGISYVARNTQLDVEDLKAEFEVLQSGGLIDFAYGRYLLANSGRKKIVVVMTGGAFDIIHPGHIETLEQARSLGDALIVSVARDSTFERNKKRKPQHNEVLRRKLVSSLRPVDSAVLGSETDIFETVDLLKPDIIALGYDQAHDETRILEEVKKRGLTVRVIRLKSSNPDIKTTSLIGQSNSALAGL